MNREKIGMVAQVLCFEICFVVMVNILKGFCCSDKCVYLAQD